MNMKNEPTRELIETRLIHPWERNPRAGELREMEAFTAQLQAEGIREDLHVFRDAQGVLRIMQGHRRHSAAVSLGTAALWCKVWVFEENEAFLHLLTMQNGADAFDARELALAARTAMGMGIAKEELVGPMHRSAETVQLYLDLGTLPHRVQEAVYKGKLALGTSRLLREMTPEMIQEAMPSLLTNPITQEPMTEGQAKVFLEYNYLRPLRWRKEWEVLSLKVKRELMKKAAGADVTLDVVAWEQREEFVMSDALPQSAYAMAEEHIDDSLLVKPGEPMTWGTLALALGVPWHVCPAFARAEKHLVLVRMSAVRDADSVQEEGARVLKGRKQPVKVKSVEDDGQSDNGTMGQSDDEMGDEVKSPGLPVSLSHCLDLGRWKAVAAKLIQRRDGVMQDAMWKPLILHAWECASEKLSEADYAACMGIMDADESESRRGLRWVLLATLACAMADDRDGGEPEVIGEIEAALGIENPMWAH